VLLDGRTVHLRPILPSDENELRAAIERADPETLRRRFLGARPPTDDAHLSWLTELDYRDRMAVVAFDDTGRGVGIARYERLGTSDEAEIAVVVDRGWRHVSLATCQLRVLAEHAARHGIRRFQAEYFADNVDVLALLAESGLSTTTLDRSGGVESASVALPGSRGAASRTRLTGRERRSGGPVRPSATTAEPEEPASPA
jgi:RimJ/RimL family protein N-acetyltransferase